MHYRHRFEPGPIVVGTVVNRHKRNLKPDAKHEAGGVSPSLTVGAFGSRPFCAFRYRAMTNLDGARPVAKGRGAGAAEMARSIFVIWRNVFQQI